MSVHVVFPLHVCVLVSPFYKDTRLLGVGYTLMTSSQLGLLQRCHFQLRSYSEVLGSGLQHLRGGGTSKPIVITFLLLSCKSSFFHCRIVDL